MATKEITVQNVFESVSGASSYQLWVCFLCFLVMFLDGFDGTILGVALPEMAEYLHANMTAMGLAGGAGSLGPLIGAVLLGMAADRFGRKWALVACSFVFGVFSLLTVFITNVEQLVLLRFIAGIGLGGAIPNALAFGSEYAPSRSRKTFVASMYAGVPMGATVGGLVAAYFIPSFGWQSLFVLGGTVPIAIALVAAVLLPESLEFLAGKGGNDERIRKIVARTAPAIAADRDYMFIPTIKKLPGARFKRLFTEGRAFITVLFWIALMGGFYSLVILVAWAPALLHKSGATVVQYSLAFACLNFGSVIASVTVGRLMDKSSPFRILEAGFVIAFGLLAGGSLLTIAAVSVVAGFFVNGSYSGLLTITTISYPTDIRGTATGWAYGIGRIGAIVAPVAGGFLLTRGWSVTGICTTTAFVSLYVAAILVILQWRVTSANPSSARAPG